MNESGSPALKDLPYLLTVFGELHVYWENSTTHLTLLCFRKPAAI